MNFFSGPIVLMLIAERVGPPTRKRLGPEPDEITIEYLATRLARGLESANDGRCWIFHSNSETPLQDYGLISVKGSPRTTHRLAYQLAKGPIPKGMHVLHSCDTPACINPDHLRVGTPKDNSGDYKARGKKFPTRPIPPFPLGYSSAHLACTYEAASRLGVRRETIYAKVKNGKIPSTRIGHLIRIPAWWLDKHAPPEPSL